MGFFKMALCFDSNGFRATCKPNVLRVLLPKNNKSPQDLLASHRYWRHSGFKMYAGQRILPRKEGAMDKLARYIIRAQERMTHLPGESTVVYGSKDGK